MALGAPSKMATAGLVCGIVGIGMYMLILACTCSLYTELIEAMLEMEEGMY